MLKNWKINTFSIIGIGIERRGCGKVSCVSEFCGSNEGLAQAQYTAVPHGRAYANPICSRNTLDGETGSTYLNKV